MPRAFTPPEHCPVCGESVPRGARACPGCGADERTGWDDEAQIYDGLDLPGAEFDREKFAEAEWGARPRKTTRQKFWLGVALLLLAALTVFFVFHHFPPHG